MTEPRREGDEPITATIVAPLGTLPQDTIAQTPDHLPNVTLRMVQPIVAILVRFGNDWCVNFVGALSTGGITSAVGVLPPQTTIKAVVLASVILASVQAGVGAVKNAGTIFSGLEKKFPLQTGNV